MVADPSDFVQKILNFGRIFEPAAPRKWSAHLTTMLPSRQIIRARSFSNLDRSEHWILVYNVVTAKLVDQPSLNWF